MAEVLGWDETTKDREVELYRARVEAERRSQEQPDDRRPTRSAPARRTSSRRSKGRYPISALTARWTSRGCGRCR